jgi:hypothetical protein
MLDQAAENRGFKFCSGFVVNRHGRYLAGLRNIRKIRWGVVTDFAISRPKHSANGRGFDCPVPEKRPSPLTAPGCPREIVNELI